MSSAVSLGAFVKARRTNLGLTQEKLRAAIGVTERSYVSRLEHGDIKLPGPEIRGKLAAALEVRTVDLLAAAGEINPEELVVTECRVPPRLQPLAQELDQLNADHLRMVDVIIREMLKAQHRHGETGRGEGGAS